nr:hypothetical protein [Azospirillum argentinense]
MNVRPLEKQTPRHPLSKTNPAKDPAGKSSSKIHHSVNPADAPLIFSN